MERKSVEGWAYQESGGDADVLAGGAARVLRLGDEGRRVFGPKLLGGYDLLEHRFASTQRMK